MSKSSRSNAMTHLFERYIAGGIRETHWDRFTEVLDSGLLADEDRRAFAKFFCDALDEAPDGDIFLPIVSEANDFTASSISAAA